MSRFVSWQNVRVLPQAAGRRTPIARLRVEFSLRFRLAAGSLLVATSCSAIQILVLLIRARFLASSYLIKIFLMRNATLNALRRKWVEAIQYLTDSTRSQRQQSVGAYKIEIE